MRRTRFVNSNQSRRHINARKKVNGKSSKIEPHKKENKIETKIEKVNRFDKVKHTRKSGSPGVHNPPENSSGKQKKAIIFDLNGKDISFEDSEIIKKYAERCNSDIVYIGNDWNVGSYIFGIKQCINSFWYKYDRIMFLSNNTITEQTPNIFDYVPYDKLGIVINKEAEKNNITNFSKYLNEYIEYLKKYNKKIVFSDDYHQDPFFYSSNIFVCSKDLNPFEFEVENIFDSNTSRNSSDYFFNLMVYKYRIPTYGMDNIWFKPFMPGKKKIIDKIIENMEEKEEKDTVIIDSNKTTSLELIIDEKDQDKKKFEIREERKTALVTICINDKSGGNKENFYNNCARYTLPLLERYANKIGSDFIIVDQGECQFHTCNKYLLGDMLNKYERLLYVDADIVIKDNAPNIFNVVPREKLGAIKFSNNRRTNKTIMRKFLDQMRPFLSKDKKFEEIYKNYDGDQMINAGVMVLSTLTNYFEKPEKEVFVKYGGGGFRDQIWQNYLLLKHNAKICYLKDEWNFRRPYFSDTMLKKALSASKYFIHFNGHDMHGKDMKLYIKDFLQRIGEIK